MHLEVGKKYRFWYNGKPRLVKVEELKKDCIVGRDFASANGNYRAFKVEKIERGTLQETV